MSKTKYLLTDFEESINGFPELKDFLKECLNGLEFPIEAAFHKLNNESKTIVQLPNGVLMALMWFKYEKIS